MCFLCLEFISGHFRTRGWRRDLFEGEQLNTLQRNNQCSWWFDDQMMVMKVIIILIITILIIIFDGVEISKPE